MSISYIPDGAYAVCTFQMGGDPKEFIATRSKVTALTEDGKALLTIDDKNLNEHFTCKSPINLAASFFAFAAGIAVGLLLLSNPVGWVVAGCAAVAVLAAAAGTYYTVKAITHKCTDPLKCGKWEFYHSSVCFDTKAAITQESLLVCDSGGVVKAFISYSAAKQAAEDIQALNIAEVGTNVVISFIAGAAFPELLQGFAGAGLLGGLKLAGTTTGLFALGTVGVFGGTYFEREALRSDSSLSDNQVYQNMNEADPNTLFPGVDDPSDLSNSADLFLFAEAVAAGKASSGNIDLDRRLSNIARAGGDRYSLRHNSEAAALLKEIKNGKHPHLADTLKQSKASRMNASLLKKLQAANDAKHQSSLKSMLQKSGQGALFFLPFFATYFSEKGRKALAEAAQEDAKYDIGVVCIYP